jgi:tRNA A37 threonylcarbamoyladenosine dehydratase
MDSYELRFNGMARLFGRKAWQTFRSKRVAVIGLGGVGSWAAEALARSGLGAIDMIDLDEICITNSNRQLHALEGTIGQPKVEVMAARLQLINPDARVTPIVDFFTASTAQQLLDKPYDLVIDAIDSLQNKCLLLALCRDRQIPIVTVGGAGGRLDPTQIRLADLTQSTSDALLRQTRKVLRQKHNFPSEGPWGIPAVFSIERPLFPGSDGEVCHQREDGVNLRLDCESGYGSASFVTGSFGFAAVSAGLRILAE